MFTPASDEVVLTPASDEVVLTPASDEVVLTPASDEVVLTPASDEVVLTPDELSLEDYGPRIPALSKVVYLLFTEGHLSSHADTALRRELCQEALRLAHLLAEHPVGQNPEIFALVALMHLHSARMGAREGPTGGLLLLEEQDRQRWDSHEIQTGLIWLARSAEGEVFSRYHAEAGIAAEHCLSPSFSETRWSRIVECYELLETLTPSPLHTMNRAVAVAEWKGPKDGLKVLENFEAPAWLADSFPWNAVMADLLKRSGHLERAKIYRDYALAAAPSEAIRELLFRRLGR